MTDYAQEIREFLEWCAPRLSEVLDAGGAREIWLQAEAYRYFRFHRPRGPLCLWTNAHHKNDLAFYATDDSKSPEAVVEIKLYGLDGYYTKNLTGHSDMRPYVEPAPGERFTFQAEHARGCHHSEGSILKDYRKLLGQVEGEQRFLLLVLDMRRIADADAFGRAIQRVDFGGRGRSMLEAGQACSATLWEVV